MSGPARLPFLADAPWRVAVVSPTGRYARNQVAGMIEAGTPLVGGVALGRGGTDMDGLPLYDRIAELPQKPNIALIYTPAEGVRDAVAECAQARIETIMAVAEYVPVHDALAAANVARAAGSWLIGPNTLGIYVPGRGLLGSIAPSFCMPGRLALIIRSGTLALGDGAAAHARRHRPAHRRPCRRRQRDRAQSARIFAGARRRRSDCGGAVLRRDRRRQGICLRARPRAASPSRSMPWWSAATRPRKSRWAMPAR